MGKIHELNGGSFHRNPAWTGLQGSAEERPKCGSEGTAHGVFHGIFFGSTKWQ